MALLDELMAQQLLQGKQKENPRDYDLLNIIIKNIKNIAVETGVDVPATLRRQTTNLTTGNNANSIMNNLTYYTIQKYASLRI